MIDLRSDTITLPDQPMLESILQAPLGDDGRRNSDNRGEDVTVNELENIAAIITGKESALLMPSGTMGNTCGVLAWCKRGDNVLVHESQHLYISEKTLFDPEYFGLNPISYHFDGNMEPDTREIEKTISQNDIKLLCLENTHNNSGGFCISVSKMKEIRSIADKYNIPIHLDGARLFHAAASLKTQVSEITAFVDTVMFCISKGLGAPIGSLLCGPKEAIDKAVEIRKRLGGGMRQAGVAAAPGIYAITHNIGCLDNDIENARLAAELIRKDVKKIKVQEHIPSNIVMLDLKDAGISPKDFCKAAQKKGLLIGQVLDTPVVRMVYHKDVNSADAKAAAEIIIELDKNL